jgi:SAM-dependent methyltransferase
MANPGAGFDAAYDGVPPWDIGRPQPEIVRLAEAGAIHGKVLDAGCGTGENALHLSALGHPVVGIDASPKAIAKAEEKARARGSSARFVVWDALDLGALGERFRTVIDCGLFHVFTDKERQRYAASLAAALEVGGTAHVLSFSEHQPGVWGPRRVTRREIESTFRKGWRIDAIRAARFDTNLGPEGAHAWLATLTRLDRTAEH